MSKRRWVDFAFIKGAVTLEQILLHYGIRDQFKPTASGQGSERGPCPLHGGTDQEVFSINLEKNVWICHNSSCSCGGNILDFVSKKEQVSIRQAAVLIADWFQVPDSAEPDQGRQKPGRYKKESPEPSSSVLMEEPEESKPNKPLSFALTNLDPAHPYLAERGLTPETVEQFGTGYCARGMMKGRIAVPIHNADGELVANAGRWPGEPPDADTSRWKLPPGYLKTQDVFNLHRAMQTDPDDEPLIVTEGFFDVLKIWQAGYRRVVALMGSHLSLTQEALLQAALPAGRKCVVWLDNDEAGRKAACDCVARISRWAFVRRIVLEAEGTQPDHLSESEIQALIG